MFYKKKGLPEEGELLICTVKKILSHSVFVTCDEYENLEGMIYISEISPGRIRNIRDYVKEGKKIICKVLKIKDNHHIDLSLRRVSTGLMLAKSKEHKQEIKAEKLLELVGKSLNLSLEQMYDEVGYKAIDEFGTLTGLFNEILSQGDFPSELKIKDKISKELVKTVKDKMKLPPVNISGDITVRAYNPDGIDIIKDIFIKNSKEGIRIDYISAPKYKITVTSEDYKKAENILKETVSNMEASFKKHNIHLEFKRNA